MKEINWNQKIKYKTIEHERIEDAPFIGALISSCDCHFNCKDCFNQELKTQKTLEKPLKEILNEICDNKFNRGIIFGGLEWTLQKEELLLLAAAAKEYKLKTILYTGHNFTDNIIQELFNTGLFDYIKCGRFKIEERTLNHIEYGVILASKNQHIYKFKG